MKLKASWKKATHTGHGRKCIVNLDEVTFIDRSGERCCSPCQIKERTLALATYSSNPSSIASEASPTPQEVAIRDFGYSQLLGRSQFDEIFMSLPLDCWDQSRALDGVGGDDKFLMELAAISSAACPAQLKSLEDSIARKNLSFLVPAFYGERGGRSTHSRSRRSFTKVRRFRVRLTTIFVDRYPSFSFA
jgi:hypothetical protein